MGKRSSDHLHGVSESGNVDSARQHGQIGGFYQQPCEIAFYLYQNFSMIAFASAIEALRLANRVHGSQLYRWTVISTDGETCRASNGTSVSVDQSAASSRIIPGKTRAFDYAFVVSGLGVQLCKDPTAESWLRVQKMQGCRIGALCTGAYVLAAAGLLKKHKCVVHWEKLEMFREHFPDLQVSADLYEADDEILTCGGGTASLDLMLYLIRQQHGPDLAWKVSEQCLLDRMRNPRDHQRLPLQARLGIQNPKVISAIEIMEANLAEALSLEELAAHIGLSRRQLERLFVKYLGQSPARYYLVLRLDRAWHLLYRSEFTILEIAMRCGFVSASHFSKCYRQMYGKSPREERKHAASLQDSY